METITWDDGNVVSDVDTDDRSISRLKFSNFNGRIYLTADDKKQRTIQFILKSIQILCWEAFDASRQYS